MKLGGSEGLREGGGTEGGHAHKIVLSVRYKPRTTSLQHLLS